MNWIPIKINSKKIEMIRDMLWFTQEEIADEIWLKHRAYAYNLEKWTMKPERIKLLVKVLNIRTEKLIRLFKEIKEEDIII